jgi:hypothetical protein
MKKVMFTDVIEWERIGKEHLESVHPNNVTIFLRNVHSNADYSALYTRTWTHSYLPLLILKSYHKLGELFNVRINCVTRVWTEFRNVSIFSLLGPL